MIGTVVIFAKVPMPGRVKTRLAQGIGPIAATWWYRRQLARLVRCVGHDRRWRTVLAVSPDIAGLTSRLLPRSVARVPQGTGDLGDRMARALRIAAGPVLVIGSDIPGIDAAGIARAFAALRGKDAVLGPSADGGYWLIGMANGARPQPPNLFSGVRWSSRHALADTMFGLRPLHIGLADMLRDVDTSDDLAAYARATRTHRRPVL